MIVTDGVIVKFEPVLMDPMLLRDIPPAVKVAPPGKDDVERDGGGNTEFGRPNGNCPLFY